MDAVLVTGCTGLVGHGICLQFLDNGFEVWGTSRSRLTSKHERFHPVELDLSAAESVHCLPDQIPVEVGVVHSAALVPRPGLDLPRDDFLVTNVEGTRALLDLAVRQGWRRFVFISTSGLVPNSSVIKTEDSSVEASNEYLASKLDCEKLCRDFTDKGRLSAISLRIGAPYGYTGNDTAVIPRFIRGARVGDELILWGNGSRAQTFTFVEDIGAACVACVRSEVTGVYNVAGSGPTTMRELAEQIVERFGNGEASVAFSGVPDPQDGLVIRVAIEKARADLGYAPRYSLAEGLRAIATAEDRPVTRFFEYT